MTMKRLVIWCTSCAFVWVTTVAPVHATMVTTTGYLQASERQTSLEIIDAAMLRDDVRQHLIALGVDPADAMQRIAQLPDRDLATLAEQIDSLPAGGDSLLAIIGITFVVLMILELTGVTNIFTNF